MRKYNVAIYAMLLLALSGSTFAKARVVTLQVTSIDVQKTMSGDVDYIYFTVTEYPSDGDARLIRVPGFPDYWCSNKLTNKAQTIWKGCIEEGEEVILVISLLSEMFELLETDKTIGDMQVQLNNKNNKIIAKWGIPQFIDNPLEKQPDPNVAKFILTGEESRYIVAYQINDYVEKP